MGKVIWTVMIPAEGRTKATNTITSLSVTSDVILRHPLRLKRRKGAKRVDGGANVRVNNSLALENEKLGRSSPHVRECHFTKSGLRIGYSTRSDRGLRRPRRWDGAKRARMLRN
jgi:hypothetical protein